MIIVKLLSYSLLVDDRTCVQSSLNNPTNFTVTNSINIHVRQNPNNLIQKPSLVRNIQIHSTPHRQLVNDYRHSEFTNKLFTYFIEKENSEAHPKHKIVNLWGSFLATKVVQQLSTSKVTISLILPLFPPFLLPSPKTKLPHFFPSPLPNSQR